MFIELSPGPAGSPLAPAGYTIPISNTMPVVNLDEILSSLDADSREYLDLLVNGAGQGLKSGGGNELAQVMERFEPTHRDLARVNSAVAVRGRNLQRLVNSLRRLNDALAAKQPQIVQLVDSSEKVFAAFASEDANVSRAVAELPGTLKQTTATLAKVQAFANILGPAAHNLLPAAAAIPAANKALTALAVPGAPIVQNQIRPFVIAARPVVRNLEPAAKNLADPTVMQTANGAVHEGAATTNLTSAFTVLNHFGNMLGYNPGGHRARLSVVAGLARPQRPHAVLGPGRQRRLPPAVPAGQLRLAGADRQQLAAAGGRHEPDADPDQLEPVPDSVRGGRARV